MKNFTLIVLLSALVGCAENIPFPSGELTGTITPAPADWSDVPSPKVIELETNPAEPYSVKLWFIGLGDKAYVHSGTNRAQWIENMEADPRVRLLVDERLFDLNAARVTTQEEFDRFADVYEKKYGNRPRNQKVNEAYLFSLSARH